jgi:hypothetical protein
MVYLERLRSVLNSSKRSFEIIFVVRRRPRALPLGRHGKYERRR